MDNIWGICFKQTEPWVHPNAIKLNTLYSLYNITVYGLQQPGWILCQKLVIIFVTFCKFCYFFWNAHIKIDRSLFRQLFGPICLTMADYGWHWLTLADSGCLWLTLADSKGLWRTARVSQSQPESARVIKSHPELVRVSQSQPDSARFSKSFGLLLTFLGPRGAVKNRLCPKKVEHYN